MAYVLVPPFPAGSRKSDYVPLEKILHMREHRAAAKGKARAGDNAGSSALVTALQGAFENNSGAGRSTETPRARRRRRRETVGPVEVVDDVDEGEVGGEARNQGSTNLAAR